MAVISNKKVDCLFIDLLVYYYCNRSSGVLPRVLCFPMHWEFALSNMDVRIDGEGSDSSQHYQQLPYVFTVTGTFRKTSSLIFLEKGGSILGLKILSTALPTTNETMFQEETKKPIIQSEEDLGDRSIAMEVFI